MIGRWLVASAPLWLAIEPAAAAAAAVDPFAIAAQVRDDGPRRALPLAGAPPVRLRPVRYAPRPGMSEWAAQFRCGVVLETPGAAPFGIETIGSGETEALSCDGLAEAGAIATKRDGLLVALVYRTRSPNVADRTLVLLRRGKGAATWIIDDPLSARMTTSLPRLSLPNIRRALAR